jgi:hypothetical protein
MAQSRLFSLCLHKFNDMGRACSTQGDKRNAYRILVGKPEGKRSLGRSRHRWEDSIKIDLREIGWGGIGWIDLSQERTGGRLLRTRL